MAENDKVEELIAYINSLGFEGEKLEAYIREQCQKISPSFIVSHEIKFGEEDMWYGLHFVYDHQFGAYRLEKYDAVHREPVTIDHKSINGIDSKELERRMAVLNWSKLLKDGEAGVMEKEYKAVIDDLWQLTANPDFDGEDIQSRLIFKYWPVDYWDDAAKECRNSFEKRNSFPASGHGVANAVLAYYQMSGRMEELLQTVAASGIHTYPGVDLQNILAAYLSDKPVDFEVTATAYEQDGIIDFCIPVKFYPNDLAAESILAIFTAYPEIQHGTYNNIDSAALESQMQKADWSNAASEDLINSLRRSPDSAQAKLARLAQHDTGKDIAACLQIRYWSGSVMEENISDSAWKQMDNWQKIRQRFPLNTDTVTISNLMRGRPVLRDRLEKVDYKYDDWLVMDPTSITAEGLNPIEVISGFSLRDVEVMVNMLPLHETAEVRDILRSLSRGERLPLDLVVTNGPLEVIIAANPQEQKLDVYTADGRLIPLNFRLDPDWLPTKMKQGITKASGKKQDSKKHKVQNFRRKGKGL